MREPREVEVSVRFIVRNIRSELTGVEGFDDAKAQAAAHVAYAHSQYGLLGYATRETDGSYTVEFR